MLQKFLRIIFALSSLLALIACTPSIRSTPTAISSPAPATTVVEILETETFPTHTPIALSNPTSSPGIESTTSKNPETKPSPPTFSELGVSTDPYFDETGMVYIAAGEFLMGSKSKEQSPAETDPAALDAERPEHAVFLDDYWIDRTEVTNQMYAIFLNALGNQEQIGVTWLDAESDHARIHQQEDGTWRADPGYEHHPAVEVTWFGANSYCQWLGKRLPTEAEWEKASRGTDARKFPWGEGFNCELANYLGCVGDTVPVLSLDKGISPYGVLHLAGNAWEWVADWFAEDYYKTSPDRNPTGPLKGSQRVMRGGCALCSGTYLRSTYRDKMRPDESGFFSGFRCAYSP